MHPFVTRASSSSSEELPPLHLRITSAPPSSHKRDATRLTGLSIEGPIREVTTDCHESVVLDGNSSSATFGARLLSLLFENPEKIARALCSEGMEKRRREGEGERSENGEGEERKEERKEEGKEEGKEGKEGAPPAPPTPAASPLSFPTERKKKKSRKDRKKRNSRGSSGSSKEKEEREEKQSSADAATRGTALFDGILQYVRLSTSPFRLDLLRMLTSTLRHVESVVAAAAADEATSTSSTSKLAPIRGSADDRWYFLEALVSGTIASCVPVLDRYGTLPIVLQALLELSATVSDRWTRHTHDAAVALKQVGWSVRTRKCVDIVCSFCCLFLPSF